jgi:hypothetical protein
MDTQQATFEGWAVVDVMGHQRYIGFVTTEAYGQAVLFRIDVPALEERERVTKGPEYLDSRYVPAGTTVKEGAVPGVTKLIGSGSIYCITPCTKEAALKACEEARRRPLMSVTLPEGHALPPVDEFVGIDDDAEPAEPDEDDDNVDQEVA